jgi:hypothetical protein
MKGGDVLSHIIAFCIGFLMRSIMITPLCIPARERNAHANRQA